MKLGLVLCCLVLVANATEFRAPRLLRIEDGMQCYHRRKKSDCLAEQRPGVVTPFELQIPGIWCAWNPVKANCKDVSKLVPCGIEEASGGMTFRRTRTTTVIHGAYTQYESDGPCEYFTNLMELEKLNCPHRWSSVAKVFASRFANPHAAVTKFEKLIKAEAINPDFLRRILLETRTNAMGVDPDAQKYIQNFKNNKAYFVLGPSAAGKTVSTRINMPRYFEQADLLRAYYLTQLLGPRHGARSVLSLDRLIPGQPLLWSADRWMPSFNDLNRLSPEEFNHFLQTEVAPERLENVARRSAEEIKQHLHSNLATNFYSIDGGTFRDLSPMWNTMKHLVVQPGTEWVKNDPARNVCGMKDFKGMFAKHHSSLKKFLFNNIVDKARHNVAIVETAVDFSTVVANVVGDTFGDLTGKVGGYITKLYSYNYDVAITVVYASRAACRERGTSRAATEGKSYSDEGYSTAMTSIPRIVNNLASLDKRRVRPTHHTLNPVLLYDNTDYTLPIETLTYWVDPNREQLDLQFIDEKPVWFVKPLTSAGEWQRLEPTRTLMERELYQDYRVPYSHFTHNGEEIPVHRNARELTPEERGDTGDFPEGFAQGGIFNQAVVDGVMFTSNPLFKE